MTLSVTPLARQIPVLTVPNEYRNTARTWAIAKAEIRLEKLEDENGFSIGNFFRALFSPSKRYEVQQTLMRERWVFKHYPTYLVSANFANEGIRKYEGMRGIEKEFVRRVGTGSIKIRGGRSPEYTSVLANLLVSRYEDETLVKANPEYPKALVWRKAQYQEQGIPSQPCRYKIFRSASSYTTSP